MDRTLQVVYRGRWLWTGERLVDRGGLIVEGGRISRVLSRNDADPAGVEVRDLPRALIHPGFLNAHVHLDLSGLEGKIPADLAFPDWLNRVRAHRTKVGVAGLVAAARTGLRQLTASGVTRVVDYSYGGHSAGPIEESGIRAAILREVIAPDAARAAEAGAAARAWLADGPAHPLIRRGLAPHSPYLCLPSLIKSCREIAGAGPFSIHAAEFPGEAELLRTGGGELRSFLESVGVDFSGYSPPGVGPIEFLDRLGALSGALLVHANFLEPGDARLLAARDAAVVFCPRSHRYFDRPPHPLPDLLAAGVRVALGTDSSASNFGLSIAEEMREVKRAFPAITAEEIFALGTGQGLRGWGGLPDGGLLAAGFLAGGEPADFAAAEIASADGEPLEEFLRGGPRNEVTMVSGRVVFDGGSPLSFGRR